ncbi:hypothetical protein D6825_00540 [Candidatus Woesearchaeota archaeon]|nr:MAG: hypothetical protein D6825_00540 [Candidatus Woesearchaeota archaeon]
MNKTVETKVLPEQIVLGLEERVPEGYGTVEGGLELELLSTGKHIYAPAHRNELDGRTYFFVNDHCLSCPTEIDEELFVKPGSLFLVARKGISGRMRAYEQAVKDYKNSIEQGIVCNKPDLPERFVTPEPDSTRMKYFPNLSYVNYRI